MPWALECPHNREEICGRRLARDCEYKRGMLVEGTATCRALQLGRLTKLISSPDEDTRAKQG